jgi:hypothetical protein
MSGDAHPLAALLLRGLRIGLANYPVDSLCGQMSFNPFD